MREAPLFGEVPVMSETHNSQTKTASTRNGSADLNMLAHVEKWMAMIREINREQQQSEAKLRA
jgi:hypothetical protein